MANSFTLRSVFTPSGRLLASDLAVSAVTFAILSLSLATGFAYLTRVEFYAVIWIWVLPVVVLCGFVRWAIGGSKCRNRPVGFAFGLFGGFLVVAGMYHVDQCVRWRVGWERIDRIPGYLAFRMETDEWQFPQLEVATVSPAPASPGIDPWLAQPNGWNWHWAAFLGELGAFLLLPACAGYLRAARPFSERIDDWFRHESVGVSRASAAALRRALTECTLPAWVESLTTTQPAKPRIRVTVWYCPRRTAKQASESAVYLSIGFGRPRLSEPDEATLMLSIFPRLAASADTDALKYLTASAHSEATGESLAQLMRIPGPHVGRAKDEGVRFRAEALSYAMLFVPIIAILAWGLGLIVAQEWPKLLFGAYVFGLGGGLYVAFNWSMQEGNDIGLRVRGWYYRSVLTWQASQRPDALFSADRSDIISATMIPRRLWANPPAQRLENEGGLLLIDDEVWRTEFWSRLLPNTRSMNLAA